MLHLLKKSFFSLLFKGLGAISFFLLHVHISRTYGLEVLGAFNLILAIILLGSALSKLGIDIYLVRKLPEFADQPEVAVAFIKKVFQITFISSCIISIFTASGLYLYKYKLFESYDQPWVFALLPIALIVYTMYEIIFSVFWGFQKVNTFNFFKLFSNQFFSFLIIILSSYLGWLIEPVLVYFGVILGSTLISILYAFLIYKELNKSLIQKVINYKESIIQKAFPMMVSTMMLILTLSIDRMILGYYHDLETVGVFSAISKITFVMTFFPSIISSYIMPKIADAYSKQNLIELKSIYQKSLKTIFISSFPFFVIFLLFPEFFLQIFNDSINKKEYVYAFYAFLVAYFVSGSLLGPLDLFLNMTDNQKIGQYTIISATILNIVLNFALIPKYSILGAGIATLISFTFWQASNFLILRSKKLI